MSTSFGPFQNTQCSTLLLSELLLKQTTQQKNLKVSQRNKTEPNYIHIKMLSCTPKPLPVHRRLLKSKH